MPAVTTPVAAVSVPLKAGAVDAPALLVADKASRVLAVEALVSKIQNDGPAAIQAINLIDSIIAALNDKKIPANRESAASCIHLLATKGAIAQLEPFILADTSKGVIPALLEALADKIPAVRANALDAVLAIVELSTPWATSLIVPALLHQIKTAGKWQVKTGCLAALNALVKVAPAQTASLTPEIIPVLSEAIWDTKADVKKAARETLKHTTALVSNKDIVNFIPALINALINPVEEVPKTIQLLSATTFVSEVDAPTLSLMVPLLSRGLQERPTATKRKCAVIIDNMSKLVDNEHTVRPFVPKLLPGLLKVEEALADPEARGVVSRAIATLRGIAKLPEGDGTQLPPPKVADPAHISKLLASAYKKAGAATIPDLSSVSAVYACKLAANMVTARMFDSAEWLKVLPTYVAFVAPEPAAESVTRELLLKSASDEDESEEAEEDEEEGEDLCNTTFSLAYGAKILLNTANLRLKRGHRYGLCGRNGSGKSTLMRAITNGQVEGFPSPEEVRTFYVEHDIDGSEESTTILDFIVSDKRILADKKEIIETLASVGFNDERQKSSIGSLSGGWKMKLALARAILFKADILLLDEPTNHLDVVNIAWLESYLTSLTHCTSNYKFRFPDPPLLEGVKTKEKSLLKMRKVGFQYPTQTVQQLYDITLQVSLSSRVAVLGPNGSGKSTLVKLLIGDMEANKGGEVWKHPNLVIGYVAQHAFHHIEQHLDKTPLQYMLWRYQTGEDLEEMMKVQRELSAEETKKMKEGANIIIEGQKRIIEEINNRKKLKQSYEYEVSFKGLSSTENVWLPRDELIKRGFEKRILEIDTREAQRLGLLRPLVRKEIEKHFADFGLEPEFVSHNTMRGLSGGQKVKIVLGAATWRRPHVLALDEPTNYLDRESLAALIGALKDFQGGVLVITHSRDFSESLCNEVWAMKDGRLEASGHNWVEGQGSGPRIDQANKEEEDQYDAMGNKVAKAANKKVTSNEARKAKKERMARKKRGEDEDGE
ncbi:translational elongation factor EF-1 alpha [Serendipita sp. 407]|nr:translational elongation factor EF-1 alpha [Serendipita sp. 407]